MSLGTAETPIPEAPEPLPLKFDLVENAPVALDERGGVVRGPSFVVVDAGNPFANVAPGINLTAGEGCETIPNSQVANWTILRAKSPGMVIVDGAAVRIEPVHRVTQNLDPTIGNVDSPDSVFIQGNVTDTMTARSRRSLFVRGAIEGATAGATQLVAVLGGITGKGKGIVTSGQDVRCRFISCAQVTAGNDVVSHGEIAQSQVTSIGRVVSRDGAVYGGQICANGGLVCATLGAIAGTKTVVEVGIDMSLVEKFGAEAQTIATARKDAEKIKTRVEPLMKNLKKLTPAQAEEATTLLYEAGERAEAADASAKKIREAFAPTRQKARSEVCAAKTIHKGVVLRFPHLQATMDRDIIGPVKITEVNRNGRWRLSITDARGKSNWIDGQEYTNPALTAIHAVLGDVEVAPAKAA